MQSRPTDQTTANTIIDAAFICLLIYYVDHTYLGINELVALEQREEHRIKKKKKKKM